LVGDTFEGLHRRLDLRSAIAARFFDILRALSAQGTRVAILTGNHDHALAEMAIEIPFYAGTHAIHTSLRGERYLVTHGDIFESMDSSAQTPAKRLGSRVYPWLVYVGDLVNRTKLLPAFHKGHWCTHWKLKVRQARAHIDAFERSMVQLSQHYGCDGVICGHIHRPDSKQLHRSWYFNCGDWVEHRSCVLETFDGRMQLVDDFFLPPNLGEAA
jgi:UDP-2,3-diacylglucosamine pyrophosphatase LpxH